MLPRLETDGWWGHTRGIGLLGRAVGFDPTLRGVRSRQRLQLVARRRGVDSSGNNRLEFRTRL